MLKPLSHTKQTRGRRPRRTRGCLRILTDHNIAESLSRELEILGHDVSRVRDLLRGDTPDAVIEYISALEGFVIVTNDKDFKRLPDSMPRGNKQRVRRAGRIVLEIEGPRAVQRIRDVHDVIMFAWERSQYDNRSFRLDFTLTTIWIRDRLTPQPPLLKRPKE